jgi:catechol 2,3-dioxygenase-like lactoylglutathione lyase family enzyme
MAIQRMDHVAVAVDDRAAAIAFFTELGMELDGEAPVEGMGLRSIMFAVDDIEDVLARLYAHGAELVGDLGQYEESYRLCYVRGPAGVIVALAEQLS